MRTVRYVPSFVEFVPDALEDGVLYVSMEHATVVHRCACGCGRKVVTPLSPTDWQIWFDGRYVSLSPSIGNWSYPCRSHYWVKDGAVKWAGSMTDGAVARGREFDRLNKDAYYRPETEHATAPVESSPTVAQPVHKPKRGPLGAFIRFVLGDNRAGR